MPTDALQDLLNGVSELSRRIAAWLDYLDKFSAACGEFDQLLNHVRETVRLDGQGKYVCTAGWTNVEERSETLRIVHFAALDALGARKEPVALDVASAYAPQHKLTPADLLAVLKAALGVIDEARADDSAKKLFDARVKLYLQVRFQQSRCAQQILNESKALDTLVADLQKQLRVILPANPSS